MWASQNHPLFTCTCGHMRGSVASSFSHFPCSIETCHLQGTKSYFYCLFLVIGINVWLNIIFICCMVEYNSCICCVLNRISDVKSIAVVLTQTLFASAGWTNCSV